jgi:hypothetical protein
MYEILRILAVTAAILCAAPGEAQQPAAEPAAPALNTPAGSPALRVASMKVVRSPPEMPAQMLARMARYEVNLENVSGKGVMAYAISYNFFSADGSPRGRTCGSSFGFDITNPMIGTGQTKTTYANLAKRGVRVTPVVDLAVLDDGSAYGKDTCGVLSQFQQSLAARRATQQAVLHRLEKDGPQKTLLWLREELAQTATTDVRFLNAKRVQ